MDEIKQKLGELHGAVALELLRRVTDPEATAADLAVAVKFLKDNGIDATRSASKPLDALSKELAAEMPFQDGEMHA
jgi:hypothetical protein